VILLIIKSKAKAVLLMIFSSFSFACMGAFVKLAGNLPTFEKAFSRNFISLIFSIFVIYKDRENPMGKPENRKYLFYRGFLGTIGMLCYFYGIDKLILADSGMLNKLHPFFVAIFAVLFLKEKMTRHQAISSIMALTGVVFIIKPSSNIYKSLPALICFMSAVFAGAAYTFVSYLGDKEKPSVIVFWFSFISTLMTLPLLIANFHMPSMIQLILLILAGTTAAFGQFSLTIAYKYAPAGEVSIYNYTNVIFSSILGILIFSEIPDLLSIIGYSLIIAAGYIVFKLGKTKIAVSHKI
jgi:drug/metabolite transporter (DMT)-like permease